VDGDPLVDEQLQQEIDLVGALVLAASQTDEPLTDERIDEILGVPPHGPERSAGRRRGRAAAGRRRAEG
jgi:hypothetical protein